MSAIEIYGHTLNLSDLADGEVATDVIVLTRVVRPEDMDDYVKSSSTQQTTGLIRLGMYQAITAYTASRWEYEADQ